MRASPITPTIALDRDGVGHGFLRLPYSRDDSAWGSLMIPFSVIRNGDGPTALLTGANHGDEYEGPIALQELALTLRPERLRGRVIIVPAFNYPAFRAGRRTSPIDQGNLNRLFPGRPDGTVSEKIADYFQRELLPQADLVVDLHAGGKTLDFIPFAACHALADRAQQAACAAAVRAFNAPYSMTMSELDDVGLYDSAAEALGKVFVTTELGGGGTVTTRSLAIAKTGLRNVLIHAGLLDGDREPERSVWLDVPPQDGFVISTHDGLLEPAADLAAPLRAGDLLARVWPLDRTGAAPVDYRAGRDGIVAGRHFPGLIQSGDCIAMIAVAAG